MVLVRRIRKRGANIVVEANAEVLFAASGDVGRWTNRFSQRVRAFSAAEAPVNKRPRWGHYGKPLKSTLTASTTYQPMRMKVHSAVGSTAPHAYYVDQGTGIFTGNAPYEAKVLPPWQRGSASLYEHTWRPPGSRDTVANMGHPVMIKGQRGQFFMDAGLKRAFQAMRMRAYQVPGDPRISAALASFPEGLADFVGNTPNNGAFRASLKEWRAWRDAAFNSGRLLGKDGGYRTREASRRSEARYAKRAAAQARRRERYAASKARRAAESAERSRRWREKQREAKALTKPKPDKAAQDQRKKALRAERTRFLNAMIKKYGASNVERESLETRGGYYYVTVRVKDGQGRWVYREVRGKSTV